MTRARAIVVYTTCVVGCLGVGLASAAFAGPPGEWYASLRKPAWTPPAWAFGPVWTLLYASMGVALAGVIRRGGIGVRPAAVAFAGQLLLSASWGVVFFRTKSIGGALADVAALWLAIGWTVARFWSVRDWTGALLLPYWAWVTFAVALNAALWRMN